MSAGLLQLIWGVALLTVVGSLAELLAVLSSSGVETCGAWVMLHAPVGVPKPTFTLSISDGRLSPAASELELAQFTLAVPSPAQLQPAPLKAVSWRLPGSVSVTVTGPVTGPAFAALLTVRI